MRLKIFLFAFCTCLQVYAQYFSNKSYQNQVQINPNQSEQVLLNVACSRDDAACAKSRGSSDYNETTESEKRAVNKYYSRLNQRTRNPETDCYQIPAANEHQADYHQKVMQQKIMDDLQVGSTQNSQVDAQRALRRSHVTRQDTSLMQGTGWGAGTVCQGVLMSYGIAPSGIDNSLDFAASGGLTLFHAKKYRRNVAYSNSLDKLIAKLPDSADCSDPEKGRTCFCSKPENYNHTSCLPKEYLTRAGQGGSPTGCVDSKGSVDPQCRCLDNNNCADTVFKKLATKAGFGKFLNHEAVARPGTLFRGNISAGAHAEVQGRRGKFGLKLLKRALGQVEKRLRKKYKKRALTPEQAEEARVLRETGLPGLLANYFASQPNDPNARAKFLAKLKQDPEKVKREGITVPKALVQAASGNPEETQRALETLRKNLQAKSNEKSDELNEQQKREIASLLEAQEQSRNQVHQNPDQGIFRIISYRYRLTGYPKLGKDKDTVTTDEN